MTPLYPPTRKRFGSSPRRAALMGRRRGVLKIEEAVREAFGCGSVPRGWSEEGKSALVAQSGELL